MRSDSNRTSDPAFLAQLEHVLSDVIRRRQAQEDLSDESVIGAHAELMPELGEHLQALRQVEFAARRAAGPDPGSSELPGRRMPAPDARRDEAALQRLLQSALPGYHLLRVLHGGGQGMVFEALQLATQRRVAIKVTRQGALTRADERIRLDREVRILAALRHPNIVTIHDSGQADAAAFFIMDLVSGRPLDVFALERRLNVRAVASLFIKVCDAVHAAHLLGVTHRDLKPGNILVDDAGAPRVLDFGLAKRDADDDHMTLTGQFVGSLPWSAPEQARGDVQQIGPTTDVYALGVNLYRMLTGHFPYDLSGSVRDVLNTIAEQEPTPPRQYARHLDAEIEAIILTCLRKAQAQRYPHAGALADDLRRYLSGDPLAARRDARLYVWRKRAWQLRWPLAAVGSLLLVTSVGLAVSLSLWRFAETQRVAASEGRIEADRQLEVAEWVNRFMLEALAAASRLRPDGAPPSMREWVDQAARALETTRAPRPAVDAALRTTIGRHYHTLGLYPLALPQFEAALALRREMYPEGHALLVASLDDVTRALLRTGAAAQALPLAEEALTLTQRLMGAQSAAVATSLHTLAVVQVDLGMRDKAESLLRRVLEIEGDSAPVRVSAESGQALAALMELRGDAAGAAELQARLLLRLEPRVEPSDSVLLRIRNEYALSLHRLGEHGRAMELLEETLRRQRKALPAEHPDLALTLMIIGVVEQARGRLRQAEAALRECLLLREKFLFEHWSTAYTRSTLGDVLRQSGRVAEAAPLIRRAHQELLRDVAAPQRYRDESAARVQALGKSADAGEASSKPSPEHGGVR